MLFRIVWLMDTGYLQKALFDSSYALKLKYAVRVSAGTSKCNIDTSLYAVYFNNVFDGRRTNGICSRIDSPLARHCVPYINTTMINHLTLIFVSHLLINIFVLFIDGYIFTDRWANITTSTELTSFNHDDETKFYKSFYFKFYFENIFVSVPNDGKSTNWIYVFDITLAVVSFPSSFASIISLRMWWIHLKKD